MLWFKPGYKQIPLEENKAREVGFVQSTTLSLGEIPSFELICRLGQWKKPLNFSQSLCFGNQ